jgi:hypothetical protein
MWAFVVVLLIFSGATINHNNFLIMHDDDLKKIDNKWQVSFLIAIFITALITLYCVVDIKPNINTASYETIASVYGIGDKTAQTIIDNRPIKNFDDLDSFEGIGKVKIDILKENFVINKGVLWLENVASEKTNSKP